jgi:hypothetical protein
MSNYSDYLMVRTLHASVRKLLEVSKKYDLQTDRTGVYADWQRALMQIIPRSDGGVVRLSAHTDDADPHLYDPVPGKPYLQHERKGGGSSYTLYRDENGEVVLQTGRLTRIII